jgi:hypothetical protein
VLMLLFGIVGSTTLYGSDSAEVLQSNVKLKLKYWRNKTLTEQKFWQRVCK